MYLLGAFFVGESPAGIAPPTYTMVFVGSCIPLVDTDWWNTSYSLYPWPVKPTLSGLGFSL